MTARRSRREIERAVEDLADEGDDGLTGGSNMAVVYVDPVTGRLYDGWADDAAPLRERPEGFLLFTFDRVVTMDRERAEREDREILGPAADAPADGDIVRCRIPATHPDADEAVRLDEGPGTVTQFDGGDP
jgi:hypothetical protein